MPPTPRKPPGTTTRKNTRKTPRTARSVTEADRVRVRELHAEGLGRNKIAEVTGLSQATVSSVCKAAGLEFDRSATAEAVAARVEDMKARRLDLADKMLADALALRDRCWSQHRYYVQAEGNMVLVELPQPPLRDVRDGYSAIAIALRAHGDLVQSSAASSTESKRSMLGSMLQAIQHAVSADEAGVDVAWAVSAEPDTDREVHAEETVR